MCENLGPLAQYSHSDSYIYLLILIAMLVIFALSTFNISTQFGINEGKMAQLSSMSVIADRPIRSSVVMTFISGGIALWRWVGEVSASLMRSTTNMIPAQSNL